MYFLRVEPQDSGCCASPTFLATWPPVARRDGMVGWLKAWGCTFDPSWAAFNSLLCGATNDTFSQLVAAASGSSNACPAGVADALNKVRVLARVDAALLLLQCEGKLERLHSLPT